MEIKPIYYRFANGGDVNTQLTHAPKGMVIVKVGSHRAMKEIKNKGIPYITLYNFGVNSTASSDVYIIYEKDYKKIKHIKAVGQPLSKIKHINWFSRRENSEIHKAFKETNIYAKGGEVEQYGIFVHPVAKGYKPHFWKEGGYFPTKEQAEFHAKQIRKMKDIYSKVEVLPTSKITTTPSVDYDLVYEKWSKMMGGNGISGTIRTTPQNYYVATIDEQGNISFDDIESMTRNIDKQKVETMWQNNQIPAAKMQSGGKVNVHEQLCACGYTFGKGGGIDSFNLDDFDKTIYKEIITILAQYKALPKAQNMFEYKGKNYEMYTISKTEKTDKGTLFKGAVIVVHPQGYQDETLGSITFDADDATLEFDLQQIGLHIDDKVATFEVDETTSIKYPLYIWVNGTRDIHADTKPVSTFAEANRIAAQIWNANNFSDMAFKIKWTDGEEYESYVDLEPQSFHESHKHRIISWYLTTVTTNVIKSTPNHFIKQADIDEAKEFIKKYAFNDAIATQYADILHLDEMQKPYITILEPTDIGSTKTLEAIVYAVNIMKFKSYEIGLVTKFVANDKTNKEVMDKFKKIKNQIAFQRDNIQEPILPYKGK
jgi:hypothetical protein